MKRYALCALLLMWSSAAFAQDRVLTLVAGFPPGGPSSVIARHLADVLSNELGITTIVENRPGAGGRIAANHVKREGADGNTILVLSSTSTLKTVPGSGLIPVSRVSRFDFVFVRSKALAARTFDEYIREVRANENLRTYTSPGAGTIPHLVMEEIARLRNIPLVHVPFQGSTPAMQSVLGGHVAAAIFGVSDARVVLEAGLPALFVAGNTRSQTAPMAPTLKELGIDIDASGWHAVYVHKDTPRAWIEKLNAAIAVAARTLPPTLTAMGFTGAASTPEEMDALHRRDYDRWLGVAERLNIKP